MPAREWRMLGRTAQVAEIQIQTTASVANRRSDSMTRF